MEDIAPTFMTLKGNTARLINRPSRISLVFVVLITLLVTNAAGKEWRRITPLKSTRAEVEMLLGKPDKLGFYQLENERAIIRYSTGPCDKRDKCECLVPKDTVLQINVTMANAVKLSKFDLNEKRYTRAKAPYGTQSTYSDLDDGVVYTVNESDRTITAIDYWPSTKDCNEIFATAVTSKPQNAWRGLTPLHSRREEVEQVLGLAKDSIGRTYIYETQSERVDVSYSEGACETSEPGQWNVIRGTVIRIKVYPRMTTLVRDLPVNVSKYKRGSDPIIPNRFFYVSSTDGIMIESELRQGCEEVVSITYEPTTKDESLRCPRAARPAAERHKLRL